MSKLKIAVRLCTILAFAWTIQAEAFQVDLSPSEQRELIRYARQILIETVQGEASGKSEKKLPAIHLPSGVFVTLVRNHRVRGCYGSLFPEGDDLFSLVREYTAAAATSDFRKLPIHASELNGIEIILSFIGPLEAISHLHEVDPKTEGLLVRSGGRAAVLLPGEARTASWQLLEARRQAGIGIRDQVELFKIQTHTVYER